MKMIAAVIKHSALDNVKDALSELGVKGMTIVEVKGFGRQKGHTEIYRGHKVDVHYLPKMKVEVAVETSQVDTVVKAITEAAKTTAEGAVGDGKIFVYDLVNVVRIRTGETGEEAL